jgi:hypothetical protein
MSTEVMLRSNAALDDKVEYCRLLADSGLLPAQYRKQPANVLYAVEYGEMIGVPAMAAINGVHVIKGKPTASASLISALVRRAGHKLRVGFDSARQMGWAEIIRADDPEFTYRSEWDLERAVTAELCVIRDGKPYAVDKDGEALPWKKFFPSMTKARAITEVARDACEEVLFGLHYTPEELGERVDEDGLPSLTVEQAVDQMRRNQPTGPAEDEWSTPAPTGDAQAPDPSDEKPGNKVLQRIAMLITDKFGTLKREERLAHLARLVGRELSSSKDISLAEAKAVVADLEALPDHIADAEVVEDAEPMGTEPNPRNGDRPVPAVTAAALWAPTLEKVVARSQSEEAVPVPDQLRALIKDAPTPDHINRVGALAVEARDGRHLSPQQFEELAGVVSARREALGLVGDEAPTAEQYEHRDSLEQRVRRAWKQDDFTAVYGAMVDAEAAGRITKVQQAALTRLLDARYESVKARWAEQQEPPADPAEGDPGWSHRALDRMAGSAAQS